MIEFSHMLIFILCTYVGVGTGLIVYMIIHSQEFYFKDVYPEKPIGGGWAILLYLAVVIGWPFQYTQTFKEIFMVKVAGEK